MKPAKTIKERLDQDATVTGILATDHLWPGLVEVAISAGLDYLLVDLEHGPHNTDLVGQVCEIGQLAQFAVFIRPANEDFTTVSRAIDMGPCGLVLPAVESPEALDVVRDAIYLPPRGKRRPGGQGNRWVSDYHYATWKSEVEDHFIIVPQIETRSGLANVEAIAAHQVTTAIGIGPYDLSMALGTDMNPSHPDFVGAVDKIRRAGEAVGKTMWRIGDPATLAKDGFTFLCVGEPVAVMREGLKQKVAAAHAG